MADQAQVVNATMNETAANKTVTGRAAATPEGLLLAYASLIMMALLPIWFGAFKSVIFKKKQKVSTNFIFTFPFSCILNFFPAGGVIFFL